MGTTLTGTTPQDTYDSLIKVTDNGPLSGTLKALSDGLGNDSTLSLSTTAASIAGTLSVTGNATFDTSTLFVDAANNRVGVGTITPQELLHLDTSSEYQLTYSRGAIGKRWALGIDNTGTYLANRTDSSLPLYVTNAGNVGINTSSPQAKLDVTKAGKGTIAVLDSTAFAAGVGGSIDLGGNYRSVGDFGAFTRIAAEKSNATDGNFGFDLGFYVTTNGGSTIGTKVATMTSTGVLDLAQGQIKFPVTQVASADPNTLDDYEEGTWTPVLRGAATAGTYELSTSNAVYTKIGRQVTISCEIVLAAVITGGGTTYAQITGLPFAKGTGQQAVGSVFLSGVDFTADYVVVNFTSSGSTSVVYFSEIRDNAGGGDLPIAGFSATDTVFFTLTYNA